MNCTKGGNDVELRNTAENILDMNTAYRIDSLVMNFIMVYYTLSFQMKPPGCLKWLAFTRTVHKLVKILQQYTQVSRKTS